MSSLILNDEQRKARKAEKEEKAKKKKQKKERKQREKEQKTKYNQQLKSILDGFDRVVGRMKSVEDMNLRCYMFLDKIMLASDIAAALAIPEEEDEDIRIEIMDKIGVLQLEIKNIMDWLMAEKNIPVETSNPLPESDTLSERRRRRDV